MKRFILIQVKKILALSDRLAEEIILENVREQLNTELDTLNTRINYVSLFREKYAEITPNDESMMRSI